MQETSNSDLCIEQIEYAFKDSNVKYKTSNILVQEEVNKANSKALT